jgi:hypothetical protein
MKPNAYLRTGLLGAALAATLLCAGCVSSSKVSSAPTESVGQQLVDLKKAYTDGIITLEQYEKLKKALIRKYD